MSSTPTIIHLPQGDLAVRDHGDPDGPVVVFVHGFLVDGRLWERAAAALAGEHRVIVPDLPLGAHSTPRATEANGPRDVAQLILGLLDHLELDDVTLVGNDSGGAICQFVLDERPERIARLVLTNCDAFDQFPPAPFSVIHAIKRVPGLTTLVFQSMRLRPGRRIGFDALVERPLPDALVRDWCRPFLADARIRRETMSFLRGARPADLLDVAARLPRYRGPVLLTWGPADPFFEIGLAERLRDTFTDARLVEIPEARTFLPWDQPERLAAEIRGFVAATRGGGRTPAGVAVADGGQSDA